MHGATEDPTIPSLVAYRNNPKSSQASDAENRRVSGTPIFKDIMSVQRSMQLAKTV